MAKLESHRTGQMILLRVSSRIAKTGSSGSAKTHQFCKEAFRVIALLLLAGKCMEEGSLKELGVNDSQGDRFRCSN